MQLKNKIKGIAVFSSNKLNGYVTLTEHNKTVIIDVNLSGLTPGKHGIHIHEAGNLLDGCKSCCAHFNPDKTRHGGPDDESNRRHTGDLGNITANKYGIAKERIIDSTIKLRGIKYNVIGRSLVIHQNEDDLGRGGDEESLKTGNAGERIGCAVIGYAEPYYQAS